MMETNRRTGTKPALSGWLLVYVEYTIIVLAMRGLSIYFILTGDIGIMADSGDFRFQFWSSVALELLSAAVLALIWMRKRHAPAVAVFREAALPAVVAARALLFGADSIWWEIAAFEIAACAAWIVWLLRSRRVREYFAIGRNRADAA